MKSNVRLLSHQILFHCKSSVFHQHCRTLSFRKLSALYRELIFPSAPTPPYEHVCQLGDPVLRAKAEEVDPKEIQTEFIQQIIRRMQKVMKSYDAVGISAPQIGVPLKIFVIEFNKSSLKSFDKKTADTYELSIIPPKVFINPKLQVTNSEKLKFPEQCESIRGYSAVVPRYREVIIRGLNEHSEEVEWRASGWAARIVQHEMDHLDGKVYTDVMDKETFHCIYWHRVNCRSGKYRLPFSPFISRFLW